MSEQKDWTKPAAMAIPKGGYFKDKVEQGRYGPIFPKTPACYGFSVIAKIKPGWEEHLYNNAKVMEKAIADDPATLESRLCIVIATCAGGSAHRRAGGRVRGAAAFRPWH